MGVYGGTGIIEDGLILYLDAANYKSYTSGSSLWLDLTKNKYNGSLINGPTFNSSNGGSIVVDGIDDYVSSLTLSSISFTNITIQVWIYPTNLGTGSTYITVFDTLGRNLSLWIGGQFYGLGGSNSSYSGNFNWQNNKWCYLTMFKSGSTGGLIKNNYEASTSFSAGSTFTSQLVFGSNPSTGGTPYGGRYGIIQIYNRDLTSNEILRNYNATKTRYGL